MDDTDQEKVPQGTAGHSQEIARLHKLIKELVLPQDQKYADHAYQQIAEHKAAMRNSRPLADQIKGLEASLERSHYKRSLKLDLIASTQMEVASLEAKLNEDNAVLITLKQRHLVELKMSLPMQPVDSPSPAAFAALSTQLHSMMDTLRQVVGMPGIEKSMAESIQQVISAHPSMRPRSDPDPEMLAEQKWNKTQLRQTVLNLQEQLKQARLQLAQLQQETAQQTAWATVASTPRAGASTHTASGTALASSSQLQLSPSQQDARVSAAEQIAARSQSAAKGHRERHRSRSRHLAEASDSDGDNCSIILATDPPAMKLPEVAAAGTEYRYRWTGWPDHAPLFRVGGQDA